MNKLLLLSTAALAVVVASPAMAQVNLELGGWMKGYGAYVDQDEATGFEARNFDIIRHTEIHFGGETTLDNGLTVGMHFETEADGGDSLAVEESYAYFSGGWGRVNFGAEDGAAYLLQVEAPSADSNVDGIRPDVDAVNYDVAFGVTPAAAIPAAVAIAAGADTILGTADDIVTAVPAVAAVASLNTLAYNSYAQDGTGTSDKLTYLSPIMNGFQVGASYTPDSSGFASDVSVDQDDADVFGAAYEVAARYEGSFNNVGVIAGAGYTSTDNEDGTIDDRSEWNAGLDLDFGPIGVGVAYAEDDYGDMVASGDEEERIVVGVDYTTGPFKIGASYQTVDDYASVTDYDIDRYTGGVVYTYGPGMTFRGSISQVEHDTVGADIDATSVMVGTQINF